MREAGTGSTRRGVVVAGGAALVLGGCSSNGGPDPTLDIEARTAFDKLMADNAGARALKGQARAILVFPKITRGGLVFGGYSGKGILFMDGKNAGYFRETGLSWGLQAGLQQYSYALFFMNDKALADLQDNNGWEFGVGPTVVVVDAGKAAQLTTTTASNDIYAFVWGQEGLMAGVDLQGSKISKVK